MRSHITSTFFQRKNKLTRYYCNDDPSPFLIASYNFIFMYDDRVSIHSDSSFFSYLFVCLDLYVVVLMSFYFSFLPSPSPAHSLHIHPISWAVFSFHDLWMQRKFNSSVFSLFCHYNAAFFSLLSLCIYVLCTEHRSLLLLHIAHAHCFVCTNMSCYYLICTLLLEFNSIRSF